jgi:hypothetical protein
MNDAMQVIFANLLAERSTPYPTWGVEWQEEWKDAGHHNTLTLEPYPDLVKVALVNRNTYKQFRKFVETKVWDQEESMFYYTLGMALYVCCPHMWKYNLQASLNTSTFSLYLHNTHIASATIALREKPEKTTPEIHEIVAYYGIGDTRGTDEFVASVPAVMYLNWRHSKHSETEAKYEWEGRTRLALNVWLAAQHQKHLRVETAAGGGAD